MAVSHVADTSPLQHELETMLTRFGRLRREPGGTYAVNVMRLIGPEAFAQLLAVHQRWALPMAVSRSGAGLRLSIGRSVRTERTAGLTFRNLPRGFAVSFLNQEALADLFDYAAAAEGDLPRVEIARSGPGVRVTYVE